MELTKLFRSMRPRAVDIALTQYREHQALIDRIAKGSGYRFVGERLGRAVFSTKLKLPARGGSA